MDDIGLSLSNWEAGVLAKNRSRIVSRRPGTDPTGPEALTGLEPLTGADPWRVLGQDDGSSLVADSGRRFSLTSRGEPRVSETAVLTILNRSSESTLDMMLFFERIDGLNNAVLGSPLIKNSDDGEGMGAS
jgi:hypothetical protein